ncbi:unnamed protein product [Schistocephalus solidus]|uniref:Pre-mRNA-splicing factor 18 n=1 Tax=Schistocephalus solidus TaxID=70667 RepID=A0A183SA37_SCHSO|nr:unnamed protein product [Schistocephalus solidus]
MDLLAAEIARKRKALEDKELIVIRLLRERNQPICLFGESEYDTFQRLKRIQLLEPETKGLRNDLIAALEKVDEDEDETVFSTNRSQPSVDGADGSHEGHGGLEVAIKRDYISPEEIDVLKLKLSAFVALREGTATDDATAAAVKICHMSVQHRIAPEDEQKAREEVSNHVLRYLKFLLSLWGTTLNERSKEEKLTFQGKIASATYNQTLEYIKPLFKRLKTKANDAFLELAIGNAPWPLGVTSHGIHSRTAQEKIHAKNVAHVLNDETQRKFIQAIKRLMTKAQIYFPADPSRCVNYMGSS